LVRQIANLRTDDGPYGFTGMDSYIRPNRKLDE
jgi:hypothetical protein